MPTIKCIALLPLCFLSLSYAAEAPSPTPRIVLPLDRTAYFLGETIPLGVTGSSAVADVRIEAVNSDERTLLYAGRPGPLWLDTSRLAPGDYVIRINDLPALPRLTLVRTLRKSVGSMQDEATPPEPQIDASKPAALAEREAIVAGHWDHVVRTLRESGLTASVALGAADMGRAPYLDALARASALLLVNPDTRPTSFFPVGNMPDELDGMSQRMILTAQANGRYPNFGGFCYGWDTTGYALGGRRGLLTYWGWGDKTQALRNYIDRVDDHSKAEFTRRTGMKAVGEDEYLAYLLSIRRSEFAPAIDLPTRLWINETARFIPPEPESERANFEKRLDAWSGYLMGMYAEAYGTFSHNLHEVSPELRATASVQVDHTAVRFGQYFPAAYQPLDFRYQTTWNDQVGGPDYAFQWLFTAGLLDMQRKGKPTWISNTMGTVDDRSLLPGKMVRVAAHDLAWGGAGIGFALEGFSNILGGMNGATRWDAIRDKAGGQDVRSGREFLDRFASLSVDAHGDHGVGILFSRTQYARQHILMGFGTAAYKAMVTLTRLGYTPRFVTDDEIAAGTIKDLKALVIIGQTVPLPQELLKQIAAFREAGGRVLADGGTTIPLPGREQIGVTFPFAIPGKPHNWMTPNMAIGENDTVLEARWHAELAPQFAAALGETGRGIFASDRGANTEASLMQINGGDDAKFIVAVNDSHIATQADWHQVRETLAPTSHANVDCAVYDCTEERPLGGLRPIDCDLSATTARVFAVTTREIRSTDLAASQTVTAGGSVVVSIRFLDGTGHPLAAVLPFHIALLRPDAKIDAEFYRATDRAGSFSMSIPVGTNVPAGNWELAVRSQLTGEVARLPIRVVSADHAAPAIAVDKSVIVRDEAAIDRTLARGGHVVLPIFDSPHAAELLAIAGKIKTALASVGVEVDIRQKPLLGNYWMSYDPTDAQKQENARAESGEIIGKINRLTVNGNDWYSALSGFRFGQPLILLNLVEPANSADTDPLTHALSDAGLLWPRVSEGFPGKGRAVVQGIDWAFAPRKAAVVIQAEDVAGLEAAAAQIIHRPADRITPGIDAARGALWREYHIGGAPAVPQTVGLTRDGIATATAPQPFRMEMSATAPVAAPASAPAAARKAIALPAIVEPKQFVTYMLDGEKWIEAGTAESLVPDLRFSQAIGIEADMKAPGKVRVMANGTFRYSDREPCSQAQWEDVLKLHRKFVPAERRPMEIEVQVDGKRIGTLLPTKTADTQVLLELAPASEGHKPRTVVEPTVLQLAGDLQLAAGKQRIMLIEHNIVDGMLRKVGIGMDPGEPAK